MKKKQYKEFKIFGSKKILKIPIDLITQASIIKTDRPIKSKDVKVYSGKNLIIIT